VKLKTSITLEEDVVRAMDELGGAENRSRFIERAVREHLELRARRRRDERDLEILSRAAEALNREMEDVLSFQTEP
jgi:metal-responsive CopG/Arc/MetJ family transcriptional regulator